MDVKNVIRSIIPSGLNSVSETQRKTLRDDLNEKADLSHDRDANGQMPQGGEQGRRHLSPEELKEAIEILQRMSGVSENGLTVELEFSDESIPVALIKDREGKVVRRIPETELSLLKSKSQESKTGRLLNRAG